MKKIIILSFLLVVLLSISIVDVFAIVVPFYHSRNFISPGQELICETNGYGQEVCKVVNPCDYCGSIDGCIHKTLLMICLPFIVIVFVHILFDAIRY